MNNEQPDQPHPLGGLVLVRSQDFQLASGHHIRRETYSNGSTVDQILIPGDDIDSP